MFILTQVIDEEYHILDTSDRDISPLTREQAIAVDKKYGVFGFEGGCIASHFLFSSQPKKYFYVNDISCENDYVYFTCKVDGLRGVILIDLKSNTKYYICSNSRDYVNVNIYDFDCKGTKVFVVSLEKYDKHYYREDCGAYFRRGILLSRGKILFDSVEYIHQDKVPNDVGINYVSGTMEPVVKYFGKKVKIL